MSQLAPYLICLIWHDFTPDAPETSDQWANTARGWGYELDRKPDEQYASAQYTQYPNQPAPNILVDAYRISNDHRGDRRQVNFGHQWTYTIAEAKAWAEAQIAANPRAPETEQ